nr:mucin-16-like [Cavia porcellus]
MVSVTTSVSTPTLRTLTIPTSEPPASTRGIIITTSTAPPGVPETTASLATRLQEYITVTVPKEMPPSFSREPEISASIVPSTGAEIRSVAQTPTVTTVLSAETQTPISRTISKVPYSESDTTLLVGTSSAIPAASISPPTPGLTTVLVTASRTVTGSAKPFQTPPDEQESATSLATDLAARSSAIPSPTVSPGISQMVTLPVGTSGTKTSTSSQFLTASPNQMDITATKLTQSGTKASSAVPTLTVSGGSHTATSWVTHSVETSPTVPRIAPDFPHSESNTTPLTTTSRVGESSSAVSTSTVSPGGTNRVNLLVTSSRIATSTSVLNPTTSAGTPETTSSLVTHPGPQTSAAILTLTVSPGVSETVTSLVTNSGEENGVLPTLTVSPGQPETTVSLVTHPESETTSAVPGLTVLVSQADTTVSQVTHPPETNTAVPKTTRSVPQSDSNTTPLTATSPEEEGSSVATSTTVLPKAPGGTSSLVTSSSAVASTSTPTLALSSSGSKVTPARVTHSRAVSSSAAPALSVSPGEPDMTASPVPLSAETSPTIPRTPPDFLQTESSTTHLTATRPGKEAGSAISTSGSGLLTSLVTSSGTEASVFPTLTVLSGQQQTTDSRVTHPRLETSSFVSTLSVSLREPVTTASLVAHPAETSLTTFMTSPSFSHSETHSTTPTTILPRTESSSALSTTLSHLVFQRW